jgi:hypothetical protein
LADKVRTVKQIDKAKDSAKAKIAKAEAQVKELKNSLKDLDAERKAAVEVEKQKAAVKTAKAKVVKQPKAKAAKAAA